ncbi:hypothetical protein [Roseovarius sp. Pro17]|uniref:hypothetical protein n=1 Tax=Roseovarius sp. Pro17 TaxID=3108175 RepID=UPI002D792393|nr:hypothetical protein [Roseovarius sp. Pro17]
MDDLRSTPIEQLAREQAISKAWQASRHKDSPFLPKDDFTALGPQPKACLEAFSDLGLSTREIARYLKMPHGTIASLCAIWNIRN